MNEIIQQLIPGIASFVLGPIGGIAAKAGLSFLADKLGVKADTKEELSNVLSGMTADQLVKMKELDLQFQQFCKENDIKLQLAQIDVNKEEAKSESLFVAGWRPFVGWVCGCGLAYAAIVLPFLEFVSKVGFGYKGHFPVIDWAILGQILTGMLGLAGLRTYDKLKGNGSEVGKH